MLISQKPIGWTWLIELGFNQSGEILNILKVAYCLNLIFGKNALFDKNFNAFWIDQV